MLQKSHIFKIIVYKYINMYIAYICNKYIFDAYIWDNQSKIWGKKYQMLYFNTKMNTYKIHF